MKKLIVILGLISAGCSPGDSPGLLGRTNIMVVEGDTAQELQAPANGQISVYDDTVHQTLFTTKIASGQMFKMDPVSRLATINAKPATDLALPGDHELKITFTRAN